MRSMLTVWLRIMMNPMRVENECSQRRLWCFLFVCLTRFLDWIFDV